LFVGEHAACCVFKEAQNQAVAHVKCVVAQPPNKATSKPCSLTWRHRPCARHKTDRKQDSLDKADAQHSLLPANAFV